MLNFLAGVSGSNPPSGQRPATARPEACRTDRRWTSGSSLDMLLTETGRDAGGGGAIFSVCDESPTRPVHRVPRTSRPVRASVAAPAPAPAAVPALSLDAELLATLHEAEEQLRWDARKPVDAAEIASLVNALRRYGPAAEPGHRPVRLADLTGRITPRHVERFYRAMAVTPDDRRRMDTLAVRSGLLNPSATLLSNLLNYGVAPMVSIATGNTWAGTGFSIAVATVFNSIATATQQTAVIALCEHIREQGLTVVLDKTSIHDGHWINDLPPRIVRAMRHFGVAHDALADCLAGQAARHGIPPAGAGDGPDTALTDAELRTVLAGMTPGEHDGFATLADALRHREAVLQELLVDQLRAQGVVDRHRVGNFWQIPARCARSPLSSLCGLLRGIRPGEVLAAGQHHALLGAWPTAGLQLGLVPAVHVGQMLGAAGDERNKQHFHHQLNLLFADLFNAAGQARVRRGRRVTAAHVDPAKVRTLVASPATALVERLAGVVRHARASVETRIEALDARARARALAASSTLAAAGRLEHGDVDLQFILRERRERDQLVLTSAGLARDLAALRAGRLIDTARRADSFAGALLVGRARHPFSGLLLRDIGARYARPGEFSSQLNQRVSSLFIGGVFGTAVSSTIGKIITSSNGGTSHVSRSLIGGLALLTLFFAAVGAGTQYILLAIKNHRRMNPAEVSALRQLCLGVGAPWQILQAECLGPRVLRQAHALLDRHGLGRQLDWVLPEPPDGPPAAAVPPSRF